MSPIPTSPTQLISGKTPWYPTHDPALSQGSNRALRRLFDYIYQITGTLISLGVQATGTGPVVIPVAVTNPPGTVPGCAVTFPRAGLWLITGVFCVNVLDAGDIGLAITGSLLVQGLQAPPGQTVVAPTTQQAKAVLVVQAQPETHMIAQTWQARVNSGGNARLQIIKDAAAPVTLSQVDGLNSSILAVWCGL
jgi:hypothetical protein